MCDAGRGRRVEHPVEHPARFPSPGLLVVRNNVLTIRIGFVGLFAVGIWVLVDAFLIPGWIRAHNDAVRRQAYGVR
ncbi:MAG: hypothetical protein JNL54_11940 [Kineosporiaceae bacterium]|nr:hypothetical protein [Kineosporiaceae bacterium]